MAYNAEKMVQLLDSLGLKFTIPKNCIKQIMSESWNSAFTLQLRPPLFEKLKIKQKIGANEMNKKSVLQSNITIDEFTKVELCIGTIMQCDIIKQSEKLLCLQVNFGEYGIRQILAGVKKFYMPEDLIGKQALFCCNLKPRKMLGLESQGMLLCTEDNNGDLSIVSPASPVMNGVRLK